MVTCPSRILVVTAASHMAWVGVRPFNLSSAFLMSHPETNVHCLISLQNYEHLFKVNDKSVGGSFYLQSKVSVPELSEEGAACSPSYPGVPLKLF